MISYITTTKNVTVTVRPLYLDEPSSAVSQQFTFGYYVHIGNHGDKEIELLRNQWLVRDADGHTQTTTDADRPYAQVVLAPGEAHEYGNRCVINTFEGILEGDFLIERADGKRFCPDLPQVMLRAMVN